MRSAPERWKIPQLDIKIDYEKRAGAGLSISGYQQQYLVPRPPGALPT